MAAPCEWAVLFTKSSQSMKCRTACAACCTAPSINSPIPGMPKGKAAGEPCIQLDDALRCKLFGKPERPAFCGSLQPSTEMCGDSREAAMLWLGRLETLTKPEPPKPSRPG